MTSPVAADLPAVHVADTPDTRAAVYRFRYEVYVEELGRKLGNADHDRRWVHDDEDEQPYTTLVYTADGDEVTGTMRVRQWAPGRVPASDRAALSLDRFPGLDDLGCAEVGRLMIRPDHRGQQIIVALVTDMYDRAAATGADLAFCYCATGLVRYYRTLGLRPYDARTVQTPDGLEVPLVLVLSDRSFMEAVGSFLAERVSHFFGPGKRAPLDATRFADLFAEHAAPVRLDPAAVWERVERALDDAVAERSGFLDALDPQTVRRLSELGFLLQIPAGDLLTEKGLVQQEMFVILDGTLEAVAGTQRLSLMGPGEVLGEIAFFGTGGRRSASVRALTDAEVLVLRRHAVQELRDTEPALAADLLFALARALADRVAR